MPKKEMIETGKTVDAAIESACEKLGCGRDECEWEIIDLPKKSFLGLKNIPAKVKVWTQVPEEQVPERKIPAIQKNEPAKGNGNINREKPAPQRINQQPSRNENIEKPHIVQALDIEGPGADKLNRAKNYITSILEKMELEAEIKIMKEDEGFVVSIEGRGLGAIIGRRGETLDAIQYLVSLVANRSEGDYVRITVDCGNYRIKRKETLETLARRLASQVLKTNVSRTLEPMNPFERRIIHAAVSEMKGVTSISVGDEPNRRVIITSPTAARPRSGGFRKDFQRGDRGGDRRDFRPRDFTPKAQEQGEAGRNEGEAAAQPQRNRNAYDDRRPPGRDGRDRRDSRQSPVIKSEGPPIQTPESENTDKPLYTKIDL